MAKNPNVQIADILRRQPGIRIQELAKKVQGEPDAVLNILNDPDFKSFLKQTEASHLSQLRSLHQIAFDRITEVLDSYSEKDIDKVEKLAKWLLSYTTDSIMKVSEISSDNAGVDGNGAITINQLMGRDPFAGK